MTKKLTGSLLLIPSGADRADVRYATGFTALDPVVYLHHRGRRYLVVPLLELGRAQAETRGVYVYTPNELALSRKEQRSVAMWAVGLLKKLKVTRVDVAPSFPLGYADILRRRRIRLNVLTRRAFPGRAIKSKREIACIREAQRAAVLAMRAAISQIAHSSISRDGTLREGRRRLCSEDVRHTIECMLLAKNCVASETIVACGRQGADPHDRGKGPLRAHEPIVIDIFPQHRGHGYWGDITRTVIKGRPTAEQKAMYSAVKVAQRNALAMIKPGVRAKDIHTQVAEYFKARGFETKRSGATVEGFFHGTGHGVGLEIHEAPSISTTTDVLQKGHVVTVEPGLYYGKLGGVRIEDTVVVTSSGFEFLAPCNKKFEV